MPDDRVEVLQQQLEQAEAEVQRMKLKMAECEGKVIALRTAARALIMASVPFASALEIDHGVDGEELYKALREALSISEQE